MAVGRGAGGKDQQCKGWHSFRKFICEGKERGKWWDHEMGGGEVMLMGKERGEEDAEELGGTLVAWDGIRVRALRREEHRRGDQENRATPVDNGP